MTRRWNGSPRCGVGAEAALVVVEHLAAADAAGKPGHGLSRIPWLEGLLAESLGIRPPTRERLERTDAFERWHGNRALGYLTLAAVCDGLVRPPRTRETRRLRVVLPDWRTRRVGETARRRGARRPRHRDLAKADCPSLGRPSRSRERTRSRSRFPSSDGRPVVADVSMGAVTHGDVLTGTARPEELVPFGGAERAQGIRARGRRRAAGRGARRPRATARSSSRRDPDHDPVPALRTLADGRRMLPGDRLGRVRGCGSEARILPERGEVVILGCELGEALLQLDGPLEMVEGGLRPSGWSVSAREVVVRPRMVGRLGEMTFEHLDGPSPISSVGQKRSACAARSSWTA